MLLGYIRCSTEEQVRAEKNSMQAQERVIRGLALAKGVGQFDLQIFADPGISGAIALCDRPAGRDLLDTAKKGDTVAAATLDRMFRSARDALNVAEVFKEKGIDLVLFNFGTEPVAKSAFAQCFFTMAAAFATLEHATITERTLAGRTAKRARGGHAGGLAPYGFQVQGKGREAVLAPNEKEREFLAELASLKDYHLADIHREINARGWLNRKGRPFDKKSLYRLLPVDAHIKTEQGRASLNMVQPRRSDGSFVRRGVHAAH